MNIDLGSTLALLSALALAVAPVVAKALKTIATVHKEELRLKSGREDDKP